MRGAHKAAMCQMRPGNDSTFWGESQQRDENSQLMNLILGFINTM